MRAVSEAGPAVDNLPERWFESVILRLSPALEDYVDAPS